MVHLLLAARFHRTSTLFDGQRFDVGIPGFRSATAHDQDFWRFLAILRRGFSVVIESKVFRSIPTVTLQVQSARARAA